MEENRKPRRRCLSLFVFLLTALACCGLAGDAEAQTDTFGVGEQIPTFPRGTAALSGSFSNANVELSGGVATVTIRSGGYARYSDYTYTCDVSECVVVRREPSTPVPTLPLAALLLLTLMLVGGSWSQRRRRALCS